MDDASATPDQPQDEVVLDEYTPGQKVWITNPPAIKGGRPHKDVAYFVDLVPFPGKEGDPDSDQEWCRLSRGQYRPDATDVEAIFTLVPHSWLSPYIEPPAPAVAQPQQWPRKEALVTPPPAPVDPAPFIPADSDGTHIPDSTIKALVGHPSNPYGASSRLAAHLALAAEDLTLQDLMPQTKVNRVTEADLLKIATALVAIWDEDHSSKQVQGRPSKFTVPRIAIFLKLVQDGNYLETASQIAGFSYTQMCEWRNSFPDFSDIVEGCAGVAEAQAAANIRAIASMPGPFALQANQFLLERGPARARWKKEADKVDVSMEVKAKDVISPIISIIPTELAGELIRSITEKLQQAGTD